MELVVEATAAAHLVASVAFLCITSAIILPHIRPICMDYNSQMGCYTNHTFTPPPAGARLIHVTESTC